MREAGEEFMETRTYVVADDMLAIRSILERALAGPGVNVISVRDGREAVIAGSRMVPDLVILDVCMPVLDGLRACAELKKSARTREVPVLMITAGQGSEDDFKAGDDWLAKPFELTELQQRVEKLVALGRRRRAAAA